LSNKNIIKPIYLKYSKNIFKPGETKFLYNQLNLDKPINIFIVTTPSQMFSAIEAQAYFKTKNNLLIVPLFVIRDGKRVNQIFELTKYFPYDALITYQNSNVDVNLSFIPFLKKLKTFNVNSLFIGYNTILYRRMVANIDSKEYWFIDDGTLTFTIHEEQFNKKHGLNKKRNKSDYLIFFKDKLKDKLIYSFYGLKEDTPIKHLNFFTMFNLKPYGNEQIIQHNFNQLKHLFLEESIKDNHIYILGQPWCEISEMKPSEYKSFLKKIILHYPDKSIRYIPHFLESEKNGIEVYLSSFANVEYYIIEQPVELFFLYNHVIPNKVIGFVTTALFTLKKLFPKAKVLAYNFDTSMLSKFHQNNIKVIRKYYANENIQFLED